MAVPHRVVGRTTVARWLPTVEERLAQIKDQYARGKISFERMEFEIGQALAPPEPDAANPFVVGESAMGEGAQL